MTCDSNQPTYIPPVMRRPGDRKQYCQGRTDWISDLVWLRPKRRQHLLSRIQLGWEASLRVRNVRWQRHWQDSGETKAIRKGRDFRQR